MTQKTHLNQEIEQNLTEEKHASSSSQAVSHNPRSMSLIIEEREGE